MINNDNLLNTRCGVTSIKATGRLTRDHSGEHECWVSSDRMIGVLARARMPVSVCVWYEDTITISLMHKSNVFAYSHLWVSLSAVYSLARLFTRCTALRCHNMRRLVSFVFVLNIRAVERVAVVRVHEIRASFYIQRKLFQLFESFFVRICVCHSVVSRRNSF